MKYFFIKIKAWQLVILFAAIYLLPLIIGVSYFLLSPEITNENFAERSMITFFRALGLTVMLMAIVLFLYKWSVAHYLYNLLPDKEEVNFKKYKLSLISGAAFGIIWGLLFFTGFIFVAAIAVSTYPYIFVILIGLFLLRVFVFAKISFFPYLAAKAILQEQPYQVITLDQVYFRFLLNIELQKRVNEIYKRYGVTDKQEQRLL
jgi:hypothetical protein